MKLFYILLILIFFPFSSYSQISLNKLSTGLSNLWGISVLNDKEILLTQRKGNVFKLNIFNKNIKKIDSRLTDDPCAKVQAQPDDLTWQG